ncbi:MAG TPA: glycosyltransferase family 4 protein, partial [Sphingomicrobium sp.]|nr:glycosyltransferase family 4 protein [Sphingomicrobium sp.]
FTIKPNIYGTLAARLTRTRALATVSGLGSAFLAGGPTGRLIDRLYRLSLSGAQAVFFQNEEDRELFLERRLVRREQVRRVPGSGIDLAHFGLSPLPNGSPQRFLFIGRLLWDKGVREFVEAARLVASSGHRAEFHILGECGVDNPSAVTLAEVERWAADGIIRYLGPTDDVRPAIAAADCIVLPSYREGVPRSLLEGAAMGRPLIATDVPGCRDVVEDGDNGFLCAPRSASALADAIRRMLQLEPEEQVAMGRRSREKLEREFAVERVVAAYRSELAT